MPQTSALLIRVDPAADQRHTGHQPADTCKGGARNGRCDMRRIAVATENPSFMTELSRLFDPA